MSWAETRPENLVEHGASAETRTTDRCGHKNLFVVRIRVTKLCTKHLILLTDVFVSAADVWAAPEFV